MLWAVYHELSKSSRPFSTFYELTPKSQHFFFLHWIKWTTAVKQGLPHTDHYQTGLISISVWRALNLLVQQPASLQHCTHSRRIFNKQNKIYVKTRTYSYFFQFVHLFGPLTFSKIMFYVADKATLLNCFKTNVLYDPAFFLIKYKRLLVMWKFQILQGLFMECYKLPNDPMLETLQHSIYRLHRIWNFYITMSCQSISVASIFTVKLQYSHPMGTSACSCYILYGTVHPM